MSVFIVVNLKELNEMHFKFFSSLFLSSYFAFGNKASRNISGL